MLLNEFLKKHRKVQEQEATIAQLKKDFRTTVAQLTARLEAQEAQHQKVNASSKRTSRHRKSSLIISEAHYCCAHHRFRSASLNAMVRSSLPVESKTRISPERNLAALSVIDGLTLLGKHGLNARCFKNLPPQTVRFDFNDCHRDSCCRRKTLRLVGTSGRIRAFKRNLREQRLRRAQRCGEVAIGGCANS